MVALIIQIKAAEATRSYDLQNTVNLTIKPIKNVHILSSLPASLAPPFIETHLRLSEPDWYTFGALVFVYIPTPESPLLDIHVHENKALISGIVLRVNTHDSILRSHWLNFPPATVQRSGHRIRVNLARITDQQFDVEHRIRAQQLLIETEIRIQEERIRVSAIPRPSNVHRADTPIPVRIPSPTNRQRNPFIPDTTNDDSSSN